MYFNDHAPPHFHAIYGEDEVLIEFAPPSVYRGGIPRSLLKKVLQWAAIHDHELNDNWQRAVAGQPVQPIAPLP